MDIDTEASFCCRGDALLLPRQALASMAPALRSWLGGRGVTARIAHEEDPRAEFRAPFSALAAAAKAARFGPRARTSLDARRRPEECKLPHHIHNRLSLSLSRWSTNSASLLTDQELSSRLRLQDSTTSRCPQEVAAQTEPAHSMRCDAVGGVWAKSPGLEMELARRESSSRPRFRRPEHRLVHRDQRKVLRTSSQIEILNCPTTSSDHKAEMWDSGRRYGARAGRQVRLHEHGCCSADELQKLLPRTESLDFRRQGELWGGEEGRSTKVTFLRGHILRRVLDSPPIVL